MIRNTLISLSAAAVLATSAFAQNCTDNLYSAYLTDANGVPAPVLPDANPANQLGGSYQFANENVYLAFDPAIPSGVYYVHVTDPIDGNDAVLSTNDPLDRFVQVTNTAGVITLSFPMSGNTPTTGLGLGGVGESLLLQPFISKPDEPCMFKVWIGNCWDLSNGPGNPWLIQGGFDSVNNVCCIRSYSYFRIGDGNGTDVNGCVFHDLNQNGQHDQGEPFLPGWEVKLVDGQGATPQLTGQDGCYSFPNVDCGEYTVELTLQQGYFATTPTVHELQVCDCADSEAPPFGVAMASRNCDGHTPGYWRNKHGLKFINDNNLLPTLPSLNLVDADGNYVSFASLMEYRKWLQQAEATNMAYMLSAHVVAMHLNVASGFVDADCLVDGGSLGTISIANLLSQAVASLALYPYTPVGHAQRGAQEALKNALDAANNNLNWL